MFRINTDYATYIESSRKKIIINKKKMDIKEVKEVIEVYRKTQTLPRKCHLNWLKENFNPLLYDIDKSLRINWACQTCIKNYLNMIIGYLDRLAQEVKKEKTVSKNVRKTVRKNKGNKKKSKS